MKRKAIKAVVVLIAGFLLIQLIPYGRYHVNPPVQAEPKWNNPQTRTLVKRACFDCHSNKTVWPWYSNIAPISWLTQHDVSEGRQALNFSEWNRPQKAGEIVEAVRKGKMPPATYLLTHPQARLSTREKQALIQGLQATVGANAGEPRQGNDD